MEPSRNWSNAFKHAGRRRGFTLIELLVIIGIVAALGGILLPVFAGVRRSARQVTCASNLRQWTGAAISYAADHEGNLPRRGQGVQPTTTINQPDDWFNVLPPRMGMDPYVQLASSGRLPGIGDGSIWICPEMTFAPSGNLFSYGMNMRLSITNAPNPDRLDKLGDLTTQVFMAEGQGSYCSLLPSAAAYSPVARHSGRVNIAFLDGHVAALGGEYVGCGVGDPHRQDVRWVVTGSSWVGPKP